MFLAGAFGRYKSRHTSSNNLNLITPPQKITSPTEKRIREEIKHKYACSLLILMETNKNKKLILIGTSNPVGEKK